MCVKTRSLFTLTIAALLVAAASEPAWPADDEIPRVNALQLLIVEGDGAVHAAGRRSRDPIVVQVNDETGRPVEGVAVSFRMPNEGPRGVFASGLATDVLVTGKDGRVTVAGILWEETTGPARIRITASRDRARAGTVTEQYIGSPQRAAGAVSLPKGPAVSKPRGKWIAFAVIAAGAAAGGLVLGLSSGNSQASGTSGVASGQAASSIQIGTPTITIGAP